ncbi:hypothetical protein [Hydrogenophaga laconesensis]|uniref:Uncharacterized protein n=1 Tax=Hydrogenophaga laconesensis TaxID=1805971 RepID=A0ABU1V9E1_9BURK|nr:hypothetical protein [Hydrogenophaga laconesensis]MDR7094084.1 hypothetical protein [Hydrogenophaga laconesensis]
MSPVLQPIAQRLRDHGPALLAGVDDPHDELLALVWGPRFDREHALGLWATLSRRQPNEAVPALPAILSAADRFDDLAHGEQQRLRRLIIRHRALRAM